MDKRLYVVEFSDLSKAYDVVNHEMLPAKLKCYGIRGITNRWFRSYLSHRTQFVQLLHITQPIVKKYMYLHQGK
jgi:phosphoribosylaminoimidazole-succinocarboxamide synthase